MKDIFIKTLEDRVHEYGCIETSAIKFYPELLKACEQNVCGKYNASWSCPPATEPMEKQIQKVQSYSHAFVYTTRGLLEDSFDYEGMQEAASVHRKITLEMHDIYGKVNPVYGAGSCSYCEKCAYPNSCSYPDKLFYSIEAIGINASELCSSAGIKYNNGENTVTYISMILYNEGV